MSECQSLFRRLRSDFPHEYQLYSLESVAIPTVLPLIQKHFQHWKPLEDKEYGYQLISEWRDILVDKKSTFGHNKSSQEELAAYDRIVWEGILPAIRRSCLSWDPRAEMNEMIELIEQWTPILPHWIKENILEQLVVPRIAERVNAWDPMTDEVPIHEWLVPWLVLLGDRIQAVMPPIRQKLAKALKLWDPMDRSALATLRPWKDVWSQGTLTAFLAQNVVPKLGNSLDTMELNPIQNPEYPEWEACMEWLELTHPDAIANIVTKFFFPRVRIWFQFFFWKFRKNSQFRNFLNPVIHLRLSKKFWNLRFLFKSEKILPIWTMIFFVFFFRVFSITKKFGRDKILKI